MDATTHKLFKAIPSPLQDFLWRQVGQRPRRTKIALYELLLHEYFRSTDGGGVGEALSKPAPGYRQFCRWVAAVEQEIVRARPLAVKGAVFPNHVMELGYPADYPAITHLPRLWRTAPRNVISVAGINYGGQAILPWIKTSKILEVRTPSDPYSIYFLDPYLQRYFQLFVCNPPWLSREADRRCPELPFPDPVSLNRGAVVAKTLKRQTALIPELKTPEQLKRQHRLRTQMRPKQGKKGGDDV